MFRVISLLLSIATLSLHAADSVKYSEIHCKHFIYGCPIGAPETNDLIIRDIYALSSNDDTKLADWVAYRLDKETVNGDVKTKRKWKADPWLGDDETLEPGDYKGANAALKTDRGHQAPLASFKGTDSWHETNYLSNITPQKAALNQGPWRVLEDKVRKLTESYEHVYVMTGPLYPVVLDETLTLVNLPGADEEHRIPFAYWKIILVETPEAKVLPIRICAFIFPQNAPRNSHPTSYMATVEDIEARTGLDFFWELDDKFEENIERLHVDKWVMSELFR